ncbi:MAG: hypothetical protein J6Y19_07650 [Kiritimatiellae bacterium]|nr:hypothetical protein [Kiritimatiellia bacterium]
MAGAGGPSFLFSVYAKGRGGILCSGFLAVALALYRLNSVKNKLVRRILGVWVFLIALVALLYVTGLGQETFSRYLNVNFSRFYLKGATDDARSVIWNRFGNNNFRSLGDFIFASDSAEARFDGNLHNSFLQSYAAFGLPGFLVVVFLSVRAFVQGILRKTRFG